MADEFVSLEGMLEGGGKFFLQFRRMGKRTSHENKIFTLLPTDGKVEMKIKAYFSLLNILENYIKTFLFFYIFPFFFFSPFCQM
ncbi:MAG: hypothetical protein AB2693_16255 [Candidatus Thiodiazotropha sp.]